MNEVEVHRASSQRELIAYGDVAGELDELLLVLGREADARVGFHGLEAPQFDLALVLIVCGLVVMMARTTGGGVGMGG